MGKKKQDGAENKTEDPAKGVLLDRVVLKTLTSQKKVDPMLKLHDLKNPGLQAVYLKDLQALEQYLGELKSSSPQQAYEHELYLIFWFAVHVENLKIAN